MTIDHLKVLAQVLQRAPASLAETLIVNEILEWLARQIEQQSASPGPRETHDATNSSS